MKGVKGERKTIENLMTNCKLCGYICDCLLLIPFTCGTVVCMGPFSTMTLFDFKRMVVNY